MDRTLSIIVDPQDMARVQDWLETMGRRAARSELLPILLRHMTPIVAAEKSALASHSKSGALAASLTPRAGRGDWPGVVSVYSSPTATRKVLIKHWSTGRRQQRGWAAKLAGETGRGRRAVFYGAIVHQGHRIVKRNAAGQLYDTGKPRAAPVPFASSAMSSVGETQADAAAEAILTHICGF